MTTVTSAIRRRIAAYRRRRAQTHQIATDPTLQSSWTAYNRPGAPTSPTWLAAQPAEPAVEVPAGRP